MAVDSVTAPTNSFAFKSRGSILLSNCLIYYAKGKLADDDIPTTAALHEALFTGTPLFKPFGTLGKDAGKIKFKRNTFETQDEIIPTAAEVSIELNSVVLTPTLITTLDSTELAEELSLLFVPTGNPAAASVSPTNPVKHICVRGITLVPDGEIPLNGDSPAVVKYTGTKKDDKIANVLTYALLTA